MMGIEPMKLKEELREEVLRLGLDRLGVTTAEPARTLGKYKEWLDRGFHGEMGYLAREDRLIRREDLGVILRGVRSVLLVALRYWSRSIQEHEVEVGEGAISAYAWGRDYHKILGKKLKALSRWLAERGIKSRWYVDTGAIQERDLAARAGLGFIGKNTMLIDPKYGSGFFLGTVLTDFPFPPDPRPKMPHCGSCQRCLVNCPTQAIVAPFVVDARRCISYLTIELKGSIPVELRSKIGHRIFGCDLCQRVCPWNRFAREEKSPLWGDVPSSRRNPLLRELAYLDREGFERRFEGTPIRRLKRERFLRNVAVALGNSHQEEALEPLRHLIREESPLIREHALWALEEIKRQDEGDSRGGGLLR